MNNITIYLEKYRRYHDPKSKKIKWKQRFHNDIPKQYNTYDCGIFACRNVSCILSGFINPKYDRKTMKCYRKRMMLMELAEWR